MYQHKLDEVYNEMDALYEKYGMTIESEFRIMAEIQRFDFLKDYNGALAYIEKYHPIYLSDTLTIAPYKMEGALANLSVIFSKTGKEKIASRLANLYCQKIESKFEYGGALKKEDITLLFEYAYCAALKQDAKLTTSILNEIYFNRKSKVKQYSFKDLDIVFKRIQDTPEFTQLFTLIDADLEPMRTNAVEFLKAEGKWPKKTGE